MNASSVRVERRSTALRAIAGIYRILAVIAGIIGVISSFVFAGAVATALGKNAGVGFAVFLVDAFFTALTVIGLLAVAESVQTFLDIEENTRRHNELLTSLLDKRP